MLVWSLTLYLKGEPLALSIFLFYTIIRTLPLLFKKFVLLHIGGVLIELQSNFLSVLINRTGFRHGTIRVLVWKTGDANGQGLKVITKGVLSLEV